MSYNKQKKVVRSSSLKQLMRRKKKNRKSSDIGSLNIKDIKSYKAPPTVNEAKSKDTWNIYNFESEKDNIYVNKLSKIFSNDKKRIAKGRGDFEECLKSLKQL